LEQALSASTAKESLVSLAKLEAVVSVAVMPLCCSILELVASALFASQSFFLPAFSSVPI